MVGDVISGANLEAVNRTASGVFVKDKLAKMDVCRNIPSRALFLGKVILLVRPRVRIRKRLSGHLNVALD